MLAFSIMSNIPTFRHGIHPGEYKEFSKDLPIERIPFVDEYTLPLSQHLGGPSRAIVKTGDRVYRGQLIAESTGFVSANLHSPVTGTVKGIERRNHPTGSIVPAIIIERDKFSPQSLYNEHTKQALIFLTTPMSMQTEIPNE